MILKRILVAELATMIVETRPLDLLNLRPVSDFLAGFIPYAMNLPESEPHFLVNLRKVWPRPRAVVLVATHSGISDEVISAVHEVGGSVVGYVEFPHWKHAGYPVLTVEEVDVEEILHQQPTLVDVCSQEEWARNRIPDSRNIPLPQLETVDDTWDRSQKYVAFCAGVYRGANGAAKMRSQGLDVRYLADGVNAWHQKVGNSS
ncbi:rhodanese-like domain-containing protein [Alicyclobacillus sp. SP_1]|uniref:rhodanese-like domain-containing protein n=1 Tax=Alicyclobacillus sp. SP_1 TaxID=2942475 RepID=UPI0021580573|nr:rhodanese-like domain-containing protein [Alicyclobacillus sp. SP_1]